MGSTSHLKRRSPRAAGSAADSPAAATAGGGASPRGGAAAAGSPALGQRAPGLDLDLAAAAGDECASEVDEEEAAGDLRDERRHAAGRKLQVSTHPRWREGSELWHFALGDGLCLSARRKGFVLNGLGVGSAQEAHGSGTGGTFCGGSVVVVVVVVVVGRPSRAACSRGGTSGASSSRPWP